MSQIVESLGSGADRDVLIKTPAGRSFLKSWLAFRVAVGVLGLLMPVLLIVFDGFVLVGDLSARTSLSAYYHSGMRDVFVAILCVIGLFLILYRTGRRREDVLTVVAGVAAVCVALFPTGTSGDLTPWQEKLGETFVGAVHGTSAVVFIGALALMSFAFAHRDANRNKPRYALAHRVCGWAMVGAGAAGVVLALLNRQYVAGVGVVLVVEIVCTVAFGVSWLLKGIELAQAIAAEGKPAPAPVGPAAASA